ncbi:DNA-binding response OmpR family regulator [Pseudarthrobacter oxydans]|uniref:DNA-binding response OmpR family regulator n=1 Tax=Pseudarthrobacter oxydans TaxID=1671 RepID=A0AAW8N7G9_PSEOX|nr:response regulator [Pseudarthrobacter oxydans]MDR6790937.1 DNA-binding response OmpR family regulator [Pseudarthrobacter oxydans]MDR7162635.1 DNA-binding response OmpR family regulator [Pseudarthrobacter oxydans]
MEEQQVCLVIEDDSDIRGLITAVLTRAGFKVLAVGSGAEGKAAAAAAGATLSLISLDLGLPDIDGRDLSLELRKLSPAPLLFLTARAEDDDVLAGLAAGAAAYLTKPFLPSTLRETALKLTRVQPGARI